MLTSTVLLTSCRAKGLPLLEAKRKVLYFFHRKWTLFWEFRNMYLRNGPSFVSRDHYHDGKLNWMFLFVLTLSPSSLQDMFSFPASSISALSFQMLISLPLICEKKGAFVCNAVSYIHTSWRYLVFALGRIPCFSSLKITINPFYSSLYFPMLCTLNFHVKYVSCCHAQLLLLPRKRLRWYAWKLSREEKHPPTFLKFHYLHGAAKFRIGLWVMRKGASKTAKFFNASQRNPRLLQQFLHFFFSYFSILSLL